MDILVIGAGIFGCTIASELSEAGHCVTLIDKDSDIMQAASRVNHNRVHFGYHYPRSLQTAAQCLDSLSSFLMHYGNCVVSGFPNYYAIASEGSFTTPEQFTQFCRDANIDYAEGYPSNDLLRKSKLAACFKVREPVFDFVEFKKIVAARVKRSRVDLLLNTRTASGLKATSGGYNVILDPGDGKVRRTFDKVVNATYAGLNQVNKIFKVRPRELRFERTIVPVFKFAHQPVGLTVMDGPFCSIMPHGSWDGQFLMWSVDGCVLSNATSRKNVGKIIVCGNTHKSLAEHVYRMSEEFMPFLSNVETVHVMETVKTVHENKYDARMSEVHVDSRHPDFISVLSGKIMCAPKISYEIRNMIRGEKHARKILV